MEKPVFEWDSEAKPAPAILPTGFAALISRVDEHGAFYQLGWENPTQNSVALYNPETKEWDIHPMTSMSHGNAWSVFSFQTISALVARIFEYLGIPVLAHTDDILIFSPPELAETHFNFVKKVMTDLGFDLTTKEDGLIQGQEGQTTEVLGFHYTAHNQPGAEKNVVHVGQDRIDATCAEIDCLIEQTAEGKRI